MTEPWNLSCASQSLWSPPDSRSCSPSPTYIPGSLPRHRKASASGPGGNDGSVLEASDDTADSKLGKTSTSRRMATQRRPLSLAHLFAAPLMREIDAAAEENVLGIAPVKQQDYARERDVLIRTLTSANRGIKFHSEAASMNNFLMNLTGCRVLHFTWNGDEDQDQVIIEDKKGVASLVKEDTIQSTCVPGETLPEVVVLTASSAKLVAGAFVRAGMSNVVAVETSHDAASTLDFVRAFYTKLVEGSSVQDSFDTGLQSLDQHERGRCALLPENADHLISPFDGAPSAGFTYSSPSLRGLPRRTGPYFCDREAEVQEVYTYMVQPIRVITIKGPPGIGKTEVALRACSYAWERRVFGEIFFVSLQDQTTGAPITALTNLATRIADAFGITREDKRANAEDFLGCIQQKCNASTADLLLVLDGCPPYFVNDRNERIGLSSIVERLCERVSNRLQYVITVVTQVGIAREKVVNIGRLSDLAAAELFVASAPREVTVAELRGGISGPQVQDAECMRLFSGSAIMAALRGHPGAIVTVSGTLRGNLLIHEDEYLRDIKEKLRRYETREEDFARQLQECPRTNSDFLIEREWGGRHGRDRPEARMPEPVLDGSRQDHSNGEFWWSRAVEMHTGRANAISQTLPWHALCQHSLGEYFLEVLGDEGRTRPLVDDDFHALANNRDVWDPHPAPGGTTGVIVSLQAFLGSFWPWFKAATKTLKSTGYWGFQQYPVICGLSTNGVNGHWLLNDKPPGTFLVRLSSTTRNALAVMYVKEDQKVVSVLMRAKIRPPRQGIFEMDFGREMMRGTLTRLILCVSGWTHLFPDTPKEHALLTAT